MLDAWRLMAFLGLPQDEQYNKEGGACACPQRLASWSAGRGPTCSRETRRCTGSCVVTHRPIPITPTPREGTPPRQSQPISVIATDAMRRSARGAVSAERGRGMVGMLARRRHAAHAAEILTARMALGRSPAPNGRRHGGRALRSEEPSAVARPLLLYDVGYPRCPFVKASGSTPAGETGWRDWRKRNRFTMGKSCSDR